MLEAIFNSKTKERVLLFIKARKEGYAREIARFYDSSLSPVQNQLDKLEIGGILASKTAGKTRIYSFSQRYPFYKELDALLEKVIQFLPDNEREKLFLVRTRPRRKGKKL